MGLLLIYEFRLQRKDSFKANKWVEEWAEKIGHTRWRAQAAANGRLIGIAAS
ncbi:hypothetical protein [Paraburkholderia ribeironis]|uniref:hypothetical protein n=1 Tax=Paraburkholderia ribeironis TaxID=1247936 RepID=UPI0013565D5F|nr:hypothetical protein [Paraburkholderia ribeironis]